MDSREAGIDGLDVCRAVEFLRASASNHLLQAGVSGVPWLRFLHGDPTRNAAAQFEAAPMPGLSANNSELMKFHLRHVLGPQFHRNAETLWAIYRQHLRDEVGGTAPVSPARARKEIARSLRTSVLTSGENSWNASFFRGLLEDGEARKYLARAARTLKATPLPL